MGREEFDWLFSHIGDVGRVLFDEPMKNHTTFRIGGPARCLVLPVNKGELSAVAAECRKREIPCFVMGNGSNLLVGDGGIDGLVIKTTRMSGPVAVAEDGFLAADAGCLLSKVAQAALEGGFTGLEFAHGIPGTFGGGVRMNAGAYGSEMKDVVIQTEYLDEEGEIRTLSKKEHDFSYRHSFFSGKKHVILAIALQLARGDKDKIKEKMDRLGQERKEKQPLNLPSAGSVFKRPPGFFAGKLIEDCGLKGISVGGAQVSQKHAGFIVNTGEATAADVLGLIEKIQSEVQKKFGVSLVCEVERVGKF